MLAYLGLGANVGHAADTLKSATEVIRALPSIDGLTSASIYRSQALEVADKQADYYNTVLAVQCTCTAMELLAQTQAIEQQFGRTRPYWHAPRTLDIDLLLYGAASVAHPLLQLPHPRLTARRFCLEPLLELHPDGQHPLLGRLESYRAALRGQELSVYAAV
ncbi:MAG: hypothetical protein RLZZ502_720 [Pseudomonadota bacterium]